MAATDQQMQVFVDARTRVAAEAFRDIANRCVDDKAAIDEAYDRAANGPAWFDGRTDGPPKLATGQDVLTYNAIISIFPKFVDGSATLQDVADFHANWPTFRAMCVRPVGS